MSYLINVKNIFFILLELTIFFSFSLVEMNRVLGLREVVDARIGVKFVAFRTPAKLFPPLANHEEGRAVGFGRHNFVHRWRSVVAVVGFNATAATSLGSFEQAFLGFGPAWI